MLSINKFTVISIVESLSVKYFSWDKSVYILDITSSDQYAEWRLLKFLQVSKLTLGSLDLHHVCPSKLCSSPWSVKQLRWNLSLVHGNIRHENKKMHIGSHVMTFAMLDVFDRFRKRTDVSRNIPDQSVENDGTRTPRTPSMHYYSSAGPINDDFVFANPAMPTSTELHLGNTELTPEVDFTSRI